MPSSARKGFLDRNDAGRRLAERLGRYAGRADVVVLALPRGGVPVAFEVARALGVPLDVFPVRKLGVPGHEELAMGAVAPGGVRVLNRQVVDGLRIPVEAIDPVVERERRELARREQSYRGEAPALAVEGLTAIVVDDGLATGSTMRAAVLALEQRRAKHIVAAVPVGAPDACEELANAADEIVCLDMPADFRSVGEWYDSFPQLSDQDVREILRNSMQTR
ncbi:MAG: phosphoribosyltransferase [Candidatus Binatia bacterium]